MTQSILFSVVVFGLLSLALAYALSKVSILLIQVSYTTTQSAVEEDAEKFGVFYLI